MTAANLPHAPAGPPAPSVPPAGAPPSFDHAQTLAFLRELADPPGVGCVEFRGEARRDTHDDRIRMKGR